MFVEFYQEHAERFIAQTAGVDMQALYERFCKLLPPGASVLDAGCGSGRDALAFSRMGYDVLAFDASLKIVEATQKRACVLTHQMTFEDMHFEQRFEEIWACASLLHVRRIHLAYFLERLSTFLKPNGFLYASFKYGEEERHKEGRYFNDLNERSLREHLEDVQSLKLIDDWITADQRPERTEARWLNCLLASSK